MLLVLSAASNAMGTFGAITTVAAAPIVVVVDTVVTVMLGTVVLMAIALEAIAFVVVARAAITLAATVLTAVVLGLAAIALVVDGLAAVAVAIVAFAAAVLTPVALAAGTEASVTLAAVTLVALVRFWRSRYSKTPRNPFSASCTFVFLRRYDVFTCRRTTLKWSSSDCPEISGLLEGSRSDLELPGPSNPSCPLCLNPGWFLSAMVSCVQWMQGMMCNFGIAGTGLAFMGLSGHFLVLCTSVDGVFTWGGFDDYIPFFPDPTVPSLLRNKKIPFHKQEPSESPKLLIAQNPKNRCCVGGVSYAAVGVKWLK
ncbi:hypothetical protein EDB83DRAFT_2319526 [Lactarius deliciosus]|nr:hypothetical protein EDB83DRAFT_2319526 [Lactarius deliciosus]